MKALRIILFSVALLIFVISLNSDPNGNKNSSPVLSFEQRAAFSKIITDNGYNCPHVEGVSSATEDAYGKTLRVYCNVATFYVTERPSGQYLVTVDD